MEQFHALLSKVIGSILGKRCQPFGYSYSKILRFLMCVFFCGGLCIEDISIHLINDFKSNKRNIVEFYKFRGEKERIFDTMNNVFGWKRLPKFFICLYKAGFDFDDTYNEGDYT